MSAATRLALGIVAVLSAVLLASGAATIISINAARDAAARDISASQQYWCDALNLLTATPVPAPANPAAHQAQVTEYRLYRDFVRLRHVFSCK